MCESCVTWLATEPPVFTVERQISTEWTTSSQLVMFTRCTPAPIAAVAQRGSLSAVVSSDSLVVFRDGRLVGTLARGGSALAFAPE